MMHIGSILAQPGWQALGWALLHFLWQGTLAALALAGCLTALRNATSRARYAVSCLFLVLLLALPVLTLSLTEAHTPASGTTPAVNEAAVTPAAAGALTATTGTTPNLQQRVAPYLPWIVCAWITGVLLLSIRWIGAWTCLRRLRCSVSLPVPPEWRPLLHDLMSRAGVRAPASLVVSAATQVPCVIGWLRPVILMPAAAVSGLDWRALEALLAHELAHIRRHDYLVNLLQTLVDTLLFYHPAVWWVSRQIRIERENCCDDIAAEMCGDRVTYARALVNLEQIRSIAPAFALSAGGGSLIRRIERLVRGAGETRSPAWPSALAGLAIVTCVLAGIHPAVHANQSGAAPAPAPAAIQTAPAAPSVASAPRPRSRPVLMAQARETAASTPAQSRDFLTGIVAAGFRDLTVDQLIELKIHGVTPEFALAVKQAGYANVTPAELIDLRIHGVDLDFMRDLKSKGLTNLAIGDLVNLRIHGVTAEFIAELKTAGYGELSAGEYQRLRIHGVDAAFVRHLGENGMRNLSVEQLIRLKQAGL